MDLKLISISQFQDSGLTDDSYTQQIFKIAFEKGFFIGNSMPAMAIKPIYVFKNDVIENRNLREIICMQKRITEDQYFKLLNFFFNEQNALQKTYKEISEVNLHFRNWVNRQNIAVPKFQHRKL